MALNNCIENIRKFLHTPKKESTDNMFRVTVVAFEDKCNFNCGQRFAELLKKDPLFDVNYFTEQFPKGFLNMQGRNFFDFVDRGEQILKSTQSDILIWGYEDNGKIRLNFQVSNQYLIPNTISFSLLDSLFIPLNYFTDINNFSASMLLIICGIIIAAIHPVTNDQRKYRPFLLNDILQMISADSTPKDITLEYMPYIMNMLGKIYLCNKKDILNSNDIKIIHQLFEIALKNKELISSPIFLGCLYNNLGQLHENAFLMNRQDNFMHLKQAIKSYQQAKKYLTRNYPYDYALNAYRLSGLYFEFWKYNSDIQALRDAVSQLREAEKIYSPNQFTNSWCHLQSLLGYYLTSLGMATKSNEVMQLAINSYKNQQKFFEQQIHPITWADIQERIGRIYYLLGKQNDDDNFMYEARNYFNSALNVYEELKMKDYIKQTQKSLAKVKNYID